MKMYPVTTMASLQKQQGVVLFMALIFMIMLALLGATAAQNSGLEEHMAGNTRNRDLALQAAEAAIGYVEKIKLKDAAWTGGVWDSSRPGLRTYVATQANSAAYWNTSTLWNDTNSSVAATTLTKVDTQPRYIVDKLPDVGTTKYYRVTARAVGGDSNAVVILQAMFSAS